MIKPYYFTSVKTICDAIGISRQTFWRWNQYVKLYSDFGSKLPIRYSNVSIKDVEVWLNKVTVYGYLFCFRENIKNAPGM